jgi:hypothetical protein
VSTYVVTYDVDDSTKVNFEIEPSDDFRPAANPGQVLGRVKEAVGPAVEAAKAVLDKVKEVRPDEVEVKFGVKVSGEASWFVAKAAGEGSFEITLTWVREAADRGSSLAERGSAVTVEAVESKAAENGAPEE